MEFIVLLPLWLLAGVIVGIVASAKGKSGCSWFLYGFLVAPVALIHVLIASPEPAHRTQQDLAHGRLGMCPYCREAIQPDALKCKHCGSDLRVEPTGTSGASAGHATTAAESQTPTRVIVTRKPRNNTLGILLVGIGLVYLAMLGTGQNTTSQQRTQPPAEPSAQPQTGVVFAPPAPMQVPSSPPNAALFEAFADMTYFPHVAYETTEPGDPFLNMLEISAGEAVGDDIGYRYFIFEGGRPDISLSDVCPVGYETTWFVFESDRDEPVSISFIAEVHDLAAGQDVWFGPIFADGFRKRSGDPLHKPPVYVAHCSYADTKGEYYRDNATFIREPEFSVVGPGPTLSCATYVTYLQNRRLLASESGNHQVYCSSEH